MTYEEIIRNNIQHHSVVNWWPRYAYHFTDIENAVGILLEGMLYSRYDATKLNLMKNDNASLQVIDMTSSDVKTGVRFYFRPKTPTQYHNEGYKHPDLRYSGDRNANVPVPVFFTFDLAKLLNSGVQFSETSQAGHGSTLCNTPEEFALFNFDQIYKDGYMENAEEEKRYRHAEIITEGPFEIDSCLEYILCRNEIEKITLLNLLRQKSVKTYDKYKNRIKISKKDMFEANGLYVTDCRYYHGVASITFSNTEAKRIYTTRYKNSDLRKLNAVADFLWVSARRGVLNRQSASFQIDYEKPSIMKFKVSPPDDSAKSLYIILKIEGKLMCYMGQHLSEAALL